MKRSAIVVGLCMALASGRAATVDPAAFGLSPTADPATNAAALQKALDGGRKTVRVSEPGTYLLDRSVYFDSDTVFECGPGVTFRRAASYPNMFVNRGAWNYHSNSNITVRGLHISVNNMGQTPGNDTPCPGLRGQVAFYNVSRIRVYDFKCLDLTAGQYCIHFAGFEDIIMDGFEIRGKKDGIHLNAGRVFAIRNGFLETGDDGIALNAGDWPVACTPVMGSIENGVIENVHDMPGGRCNFARVITGCWKEWHSGMRLQRGDIFTVGKNVYSVALPDLSTNEYVSLTAPSHTRGVWTSPEGIPFLWLQNDGETRADIRNVVFRDCFLHSKRSVSCSWEFGGYARLVHPEIDPKDFPVIDITLENVVSDSGATIVSGNASATLRLFNCRSAGSLVSMGGGRVRWDSNTYPTVRRILASGCTFAGPEEGRAPDFLFTDPNGDVQLTLCGNLQERPVRVSAPKSSKFSVRGDSEWKQ